MKTLDLQCWHRHSAWNHRIRQGYEHKQHTTGYLRAQVSNELKTGKIIQL